MRNQPTALPPGTRFRLREFDPAFTGDFKHKDEVRDAVAANLARLTELQDMLYAEGKHGLLVVLQAMDTGGKDGTVTHVMGAFNPQGVGVTAFKVPSAEELAHDFLWRVHKAVPERGRVGIFNRSHYEDVLVVRVRKLAPEPVWRPRYRAINEFERTLAESGIAIVKLFLHISKDEQAERLRDRLRDPTKQWKFNPGDLDDRALWSDYTAAYEDALTECNTSYAPWHVIPANHKWYRDHAVSAVLVDALGRLGLRYPAPAADLARYTIED